MKKFLFLLFFLALSLVAFFYYYTSPVDPASSLSKTVVIKRGATITSIANTLKNKGIIRSPFFFKLYIKLFKPTLIIQAGSFKLSPSYSLSRLIQELQKGRLDKWVTFPEGLRNEEIATILSKELGLNKQEFLNLAKPYLGQLFPDTYLFSLHSTPQKIINLMLANYTKKTKNLQKAIQTSSFSEQEILTLASIIERETLTEQEKPIVAGILIKRLKNNWPLQTDATIQYIIGKPGNWWPVPTKKDLHIFSPYNTYLNPGLPPTPIANPGLSSIKAVLYPADSPYWFYLHDKQGNIHYARTAEEHARNITKYLLTD